MFFFSLKIILIFNICINEEGGGLSLFYALNLFKEHIGFVSSTKN